MGEEESEMNRLKKIIIWCALMVAAISLMVLESRADDEKQQKNTYTLSVGEVTEQISEYATKSTRYSLDMLGISSMECNCSFISEEDEQLWLFHAEPKINGVERGGPSHRKLKKGDVIVAIDGMLITTRKAGIRFANLTAGEPVELTVRRRGQTRSVTVVPKAVLDHAVPFDLTVHRDDPSNTITIEPNVTGLQELARSIETLSLRAAEIGVMIDSVGLPAPPGFPSFPEFNIDFGAMFPRGWIGFGLSFHGSIQNKDEDKPAEWRFNDPPTIKSVQPDSPADKAGLQVNDVLLEIDGLKLDSRKGGKRFSRMEPGQVVEWKVQRGAKTFTVETEACERPAPEHAIPLQEPVQAAVLQPLIYTGNLDGTEIEVRGGKNVHIVVDEETGEIVIRSVDSVTRLKPKKK
jgi:S1-C subfamily serine protease